MGAAKSILLVSINMIALLLLIPVLRNPAAPWIKIVACLVLAFNGIVLVTNIVALLVGMGVL